MTSSNDKCKSDSIIDEIFELLDADYLNQIIDRPIEQAFESFEFNLKIPMTFHDFIKIIGNFTTHLYRFGPGVSKILTESQARSEAMHIIENCYWQCSKDIRLDTAYLDAADNETAGIQNVLQQMANHIKEKAHTRHIKWVYATRLNPLDWKTQCLIVRTLMQQEKQYIPSDLLSCHPEQLANYLDDLMEQLISVNNIVQKKWNRTNRTAANIVAGDH